MTGALDPGITIISTDGHVMEPPDLWSARIDRRFADRAPHLVSEPEADWWWADGFRLQSVNGGSQAGVRFEDQTKLAMTARMDEVAKGAYDPTARLVDMDLDGIQFEVMYPTLGLRLWRLPDAELLAAIHRAYNDWLAEFCRAYPDRLAGVGLVLLDDIDSGVAELRRIADLGMCGAMITVHPGFDQSYDHPMYEPVWATAEDLGLPLSLHIGTNRISSNSPNNGYDTKFLQHPTQYATASYWVQCSISDMIFAGVFEKHPGLKVVSLEHEAAWAPGLIQVMDYTYTQRARRESWHRFPDGILPSDYFHNNVYISMQEDPVAVRLRDVIGLRNLVWGDDFPHHESTFPKSREILGEILTGVPDEEQEMILHSNPLELYNLSPR